MKGKKVGRERSVNLVKSLYDSKVLEVLVLGDNYPTELVMPLLNKVMNNNILRSTIRS